MAHVLKKPRDVFLSYSMPEDEGVVRKISADLEAHGVSCWYAKKDHKRGLFPMAIMQAIAECKIFALVLTDHSNKSAGFIAGEVHAAFTRFLKENDSFDIQVFRLDKCELDSKGLNLFLGMFPWIDGGLSSDPDVGELTTRVLDVLKEMEQEQEAQCQTENPPDVEQVENPSETERTDAPESEEEAKEKAEKEEEVKDALRQEAAEAEEARKKREQENRKRKRQRTLLLLATLSALIAICIAVWRFLPSISVPSDSGLTIEPKPEPTYEELRYQEAERDVQKGGKQNRLKAAMIWGSLGDYRDAKERSFAIWKEYRTYETLSAGNGYTVCVFRDGTADSVGRSEQVDASNWSGIIEASAGENHAVGLRENGAVIGAGERLDGLSKLNWTEWRDIVAVSAGDTYTAALRSDGTALYVNNALPQNPRSPQPPPLPHYNFLWSDSDFVAISAGGKGHVVGLHADGTVDATGNKQYGKCDVKDWRDIVAVSAGYDHTVGLYRSGKVVAIGYNGNGQCNVGDWSNIKAISAGGRHTVGLDNDGRVCATGDNEYGQCDVSEWKDVVAVSAGWGHTVGLTCNGGILFAGYGAAGINEDEIPAWNDIRFPTD